MGQLTMALDKAVVRNSQTLQTNPTPTRVDHLQGMLDGPMDSGKSADINRRLNDLLNEKDDIILNLNNQIMELKLSSDDPRGVRSPKQPLAHMYHNKDEQLTDLRNRLVESDKMQKEYLRTINAMKIIQDH
jgi:uncharacterized protein YaaR (DUF327 family)